MKNRIGKFIVIAVLTVGGMGICFGSGNYIAISAGNHFGLALTDGGDLYKCGGRVSSTFVHVKSNVSTFVRDTWSGNLRLYYTPISAAKTDNENYMYVSYDPSDAGQTYKVHNKNSEMIRAATWCPKGVITYGKNSCQVNGGAMLMDNRWLFGKNYVPGFGSVVDGAQATRILVGPIKVVFGQEYMLVMLSDRTLWAYGSGMGMGGQDGTIVATNVIDVAAGYDHTIIVKADFTAWGTGTCGNNELGAEIINPDCYITGWTQICETPHNPLTGVRRVSAGDGTSFFLMSNGTVKSCGKNDRGQLGWNLKPQNPEVKVLNCCFSGTGTIPLSGVTAVSAGKNHTLVLINGYVYAAGDDSQGQLGINSNDAPDPMQPNSVEANSFTPGFIQVQ